MENSLKATLQNSLESFALVSFPIDFRTGYGCLLSCNAVPVLTHTYSENEADSSYGPRILLHRDTLFII